MGNSGSKKSTTALTGLTEQERVALTNCVRKAGNFPQQDSQELANRTVSPTALSKELSQRVPERIRVAIGLFAAKCAQRHGQDNNNTVTLIGLAEASRVLVFGNATEKADFVEVYAAANAGAGAKELLQDIGASVGLYEPKANSAYVINDSFLWFLTEQSRNDVVAGDDTQSDTSASPPPFPDLASFETWFQQNRYLQNLWKVLFQFAFFGRLPEFPSMVGGSSSLLMIEDRYVLHTSLPSEFKSEKTWFRLFTGDQNGKSWTVFMGKVVEAGSILFVFRDKDDHIFGAFAAADLKTGPNFFGNSSSFLYSLRPRMGIYQSTGYNSNYQYMNHGAATYPNGLGFGGQLDYFGLWISSSFEGGHSKASPRSTTFDSPRLSNKEEFTLDYCEAWLIKPKEVDDRLIDPKQAKKSVLDDDITSSLLEMSGRRMYSKEVGRNDEPSNNEPAG